MSIKVKKIIAVVLAISSLLALCSCSAGREKIDLEDFITIKFSKYNGYGTANINLDEEALEPLIDYEKASEFCAEIRELGGETTLSLAFLEKYTDLFSVEFVEEYENLSNGDKVKIVVKSELEEIGYDLKDVEKGLGIKFKDTEITYEVEGLVDAKVIDVLDGIEEYVKYRDISGIKDAPSGEVYPTIIFPEDYERKIDDIYLTPKSYYRNVLNVVYNHEIVAELVFEASGQELSIGDEFVVSVYENDSSLDEYDYVLAHTNKKLTVPKIIKRLTSKEELTNDRITTIKEKALKYAKEELNSEGFCKVYFYSPKPSAATTACGIVVIADSNTWLSLNGYRKISVQTLITPDDTLEVEFNAELVTYDTFEDVYETQLNHNAFVYEEI